MSPFVWWAGLHAAEITEYILQLDDEHQVRFPIFNSVKHTKRRCMLDFNLFVLFNFIFFPYKNST